MGFDGWAALIGALGAAAVLASRRLRDLPVTGPLIALLVGVAIGPRGAGLVEAGGRSHLLHLASEGVLAVSLVAVALRYRFEAVRAIVGPVALLITVGMVAMALSSAALAGLVLGLPLAAALVLGAVLAPTDPVLASSVVTGEPAEEHLPARLRRVLSIESGANDGLAWPFVVVAVAIAAGHGAASTAVEVAWGLVAAVAGGLLIGWGCGAAFRWLERRRDIEASAYFIFTLTLAIGTLGAVNLLGGDGVLAVFVAGLAYNRTVGESTFAEERDVEEGINQVLVLPLFVLLGTVLPWEAWGRDVLALCTFAAAVLVLRRLPIVLALRARLGFSLRDAVFVGWFGPIGVAAVFYVTLALDEWSGAEQVWPAAALVVAASTVVHGVTTVPGRRAHERASAAAVGAER